jgi:hypothetical protein
MMQWQIPQNKGADEIDEHDMPTEPIHYEAMSPSAPTVSEGASSPSDEVVPVPQPLEQPFPRQYVPVIPSQVASPYVPAGGVYPVLPPAQPRKGKQSTDGAIGSGMGQPQPPKDAQSIRATQSRRSSAPALVKLFFIAVRLLLAVQFVLTILRWPDSALWVRIVYALSPVFVWPVQTLIEQIHLPFTLWPAIITLLAIVFYSVLSRILVGFLKAIRGSR